MFDSSVLEFSLWAILSLLVLVGVIVLLRRKGKSPAPSSEGVAQQEAVAPPSNRLIPALSKTRSHWWSELSELFTRSTTAFNEQDWEKLEEALITSDVSVATAGQLLQKVRSKTVAGTENLKTLMEEEIESLLARAPVRQRTIATKPRVVSIVGVNGVGKTTTVGKVAHRLTRQGQSVLLGACDTFRAAAIAQLKVWSERAGCEFVAGREGADPGATAFDAVSAGKARGVDVVLLDTAGRLHTKAHLMDELKRVHKVVKKVIPDAPHEVWLVVDGTLGQNSIVQAKMFHEALDVTGLIVTKLDGTAKGGAVLSIVHDMGLPIFYIGIGESSEDLVDFEPRSFAKALLATSN